MAVSDFVLEPLRHNDPHYDGLASAAEQKYGLPSGLLVAIKNAGERSDPGQVSPKQARGVMQFIPETAKAYGVDTNDQGSVIDGAGRMMRDLMKQYSGNVGAAIAHYNGGTEQGRLVAAGQEPQFPETRAYLQRVAGALGGAGARAQPVAARTPATIEGEFTLEPVETPADRATAANQRFTRAAQGDRSAMPTDQKLTVTGGFLDNAKAGAGKAVSDLGLGIKQGAQKIGRLVGAVDDATMAATNAEATDRRQRDAALMRTGGGITGNIAGNIAMTALPGAALARGGALLPAASNVGRVMTTVGQAVNVPRTFGQAAAVGAGLGALQPVTGEGGELERLVNAGMGGAGGALGLGVGRGIGAAVRSGRAALEPFFDKGQEAIIGRALTKASGGESGQVVQRLRDAATPAMGPNQPGLERQVMGEIVPGSLPTVGQAAQNPGIAALERAAVAIDPTTAVESAGRMDAQNLARRALLDRVAGTDGARDMFGAARDATAEQLYQQAFRTGIRPAAAARAQPEIEALLQNPAIQDALPVARRLARFDQIDINDPQGSLQGLHYVKKALDDMLDRGRQTGVGRIELSKIAQTKDALLGLMDRLSPAYATARAEFQAASRPLNAMDTAAEISRRAVNPLTERLQAAAYARALNDGTAAKATGFRGSTLENTLEPQQLGQMNAILEDLQRATAAQNAGRGVGSDTVQKLAYSNLLDQSGVPTFLQRWGPTQTVGNLASRLADSLYGRANRDIAARLAGTMMDPGEAARMMTTGAVTPVTDRLIRAITDKGLVPLGIGGGVTAQNLLR